MSKQINEPFDDKIRSSTLPENIIFRLAVPQDIDAIANLMHLRNPSLEYSEVMDSTTREVGFNITDQKYRVFVADLAGEVVGFCRYYHSHVIKKEKVHETPEGFYCMGTLVDPTMRRKNIARFLVMNRFEWLRNEGVELVYSGVAADNPASLKMHEEFGFRRAKEVSGFHHISFDCGSGYLFQKKLS